MIMNFGTATVNSEGINFSEKIMKECSLYKGMDVTVLYDNDTGELFLCPQGTLKKITFDAGDLDDKVNLKRLISDLPYCRILDEGVNFDNDSEEYGDFYFMVSIEEEHTLQIIETLENFRVFSVE